MKNFQSLQRMLSFVSTNDSNFGELPREIVHDFRLEVLNQDSQGMQNFQYKSKTNQKSEISITPRPVLSNPRQR